MKHEHAAAAAAGVAAGTAGPACPATAAAAPRAARRAAHRVAVIGHGPAAIETSDLLICMGDYFVDLFSPTPAPTCLIRFGTTHRAGAAACGGAASDAGRDNLVPRLRLFGNVQVGSGAGAVSVGELTHYYDTVIVASDASAGAAVAGAGGAVAGAGLVVVGNSRGAAATYHFLRSHTALPISRTPVVTDPAASAAADRPGAVVALLESRSIPFTTWSGWHRPAWAGAVAGAGLGAASGSVVTAADWFSLVAVARAVPDTP